MHHVWTLEGCFYDENKYIFLFKKCYMNIIFSTLYVYIFFIKYVLNKTRFQMLVYFFVYI